MVQNSGVIPYLSIYLATPYSVIIVFVSTLPFLPLSAYFNSRFNNLLWQISYRPHVYETLLFVSEWQGERRL